MTAAGRRPGRPFPRVLATPLLLAGGLLTGALLSELGVRLYAALSPRLGARILAYDPMAVLIEPVGTVGYRQRPGARFRYVTGAAATANALGYRGPEVSRAKPPGVIRIILLGGSTTHGWGVDDDHTIDAHMRRILAARVPHRRFEVVNLAFDGYDSYQDFVRFSHDGLPLSPDVVIVNNGINDVRNARFPDLRDRDPRTLLWRGPLARLREEQRNGGPAVGTLLKHYSLVARLPGFLRNEMAWSAEEVMSDTGTVHPDAADYFERNLRRIATVARSRSIAVIFSTPPSALRANYAPDSRSTMSYWVGDAETTATYRDTLSARMRDLVLELSTAGQPAVFLHPDVPAHTFLDDAHLTPEGNRLVAETFVAATLRVIEPTP